ncbi:MAG: hypothetical protein AB9835_03035 [Eubacteriales bacterium]
MSEVLHTYAEFLDYVNNKGVLAFSAGMPESFPSLNGLVSREQWHTGDPETDPWQWKDRAASEKVLAFGCILNGHKGFVSQKLYPLFYSAFRPSADPEERYEYGEVAKEALSVWELLRDGADVSTFDITAAFKSFNKSRLERAVVSLQKEYYITVSGNRRKMNAKGEEYGWPSNTYAAVDVWAKDWLSVGMSDRVAAREAVVSHCLDVFPGLDSGALRKVLFGRG